jgi:hypothetical protein
VADYRSIIEKAVSALDLNIEKALYERARAALRLKMHSAHPPRSEIAAEMSLEMAIEAVEAEAVRGQNASLARASREVDNEGRNLTPRWMLAQNVEANRSIRDDASGRMSLRAFRCSAKLGGLRRGNTPPSHQRGLGRRRSS